MYLKRDHNPDAGNTLIKAAGVYNLKKLIRLDENKNESKSSFDKKLFEPFFEEMKFYF